MKSLFAILALSALASAWQINIGNTRVSGNQGRPCQSVRGGGRREREERNQPGGNGNSFYDWDPTVVDIASAAAPAPSHCCLLLFDNANCYHGTGTAFERQCKDPYSGPTRNVPGAPAGFSAGSYDIKAFEVFCYDRNSRD
jgi:hypothetical protein